MRLFRAIGSSLGPTLAVATVLGIALPVLTGCGWTPLYADPETVPADSELLAVRVSPIPERIGQRLTMGLRESFNPSGAPVPQRYTLNVTLVAVRANLGVQTTGLGTRARLDAVAGFRLLDNKSGGVLLQASSHDAESFDILANEYSNVVAEEDARNRAAEELRRDIVSRVTAFLQRRVAEQAGKPAP